MVFHAFGVYFGDIGWDADGPQQSENEFVSFFRRLRQLFSFFGQEHTPVGSLPNISPADESLDGFGHCDMAHPKSLGKVHASGFAMLCNEFLDQFDVIGGGFQ